MIVSILQLMGFPMAKPVHSRAEEPPPKKPAKGHGGTISPTDQAQERSARRQEVKAKTGKDSKAAAAPKNKAAVSVSAKPAGKSAAKPQVKAVPKPVAKKAIPVKVAPKPAPKPVAKPVSKSVSKPVSKAPLAKASKPAVKVAAKTVAKPVVLAKKTAAKATPVPSAKPAPKAASQPVSKPRAPASPDPMPVSPKSVKSDPVPVTSKSKPVVSAPPVVEKVAVIVAAPVPAKAGRPSSRLAQLTVPSIAQSVASTAAKASYTQATPSPLIVPALPSSIKKDAKLANNWKTTPAANLSDAELMAMPDSEYMNAVQMAAFRAKLVKLKLDILSSAGETTEHLREDTSVVPDPADRATIEEEHALELRTRDRERKLLKKIEQSIVRIDAGDYGYCDETGEAIGVGRLLARPTATLSLEAQQRRELKQKMFGD
jgi:DnaK suppressor protein